MKMIIFKLLKKATYRLNAPIWIEVEITTDVLLLVFDKLMTITSRLGKIIGR